MASSSTTAAPNPGPAQNPVDPTSTTTNPSTTDNNTTTTSPTTESTFQTAPNVTLTPHQTTLLTSVLDLFAGRPTLAKLALWRDDATFADPLTIAQGRDKYAAQWYGLAQAFSTIEPLKREVTDGGNPILVDMKTKYVVKVIGKEQVIDSVVAIWADDEGKIEKVEDRWGGKLPEGAIANAFRHLNAVTVPKIVSVPKNEEDEVKKGYKK